MPVAWGWLNWRRKQVTRLASSGTTKGKLRLVCTQKWCERPELKVSTHVSNAELPDTRTPGSSGTISGPSSARAGDSGRRELPECTSGLVAALLQG